MGHGFDTESSDSEEDISMELDNYDPNLPEDFDWPSNVIFNFSKISSIPVQSKWFLWNSINIYYGMFPLNHQVQEIDKSYLIDEKILISLF